jgi:hypothetical protein
LQSWRAQVVVNTVKALIPAKQSVRQVWRKISPYRTDPQKDGCLFNNAIRQIENLRGAGFSVRGKRVLEIGTGWHPVTAMVFLAAGASHVILTDIERLLDPNTLRSAIDFVLQRRSVLEERIGDCGFEKLKVPQGTLPQMLKALNLTYCVPYRSSMTAPGSVDLIVSCSVLEHIRPADLASMMGDCRDALSPAGAMVHFIDNSDHYEQGDKRISRINFLRYEDAVWNLFCLNPQAVQNRLRHSDYVALFAGLGFSIGYEWREVRERELDQLAEIPLAKKFRGRPPEDLAAISSHFVISK